jgi:hypothetical protein
MISFQAMPAIPTPPASGTLNCLSKPSISDIASSSITASWAGELQIVEVQTEVC